jgi:RsiW-degrading membrane proteinase PrsW (M82 family)
MAEAARYCAECGKPAAKPLPWTRQSWWRILLVGIGLYWLTSELLKASGNPNFAPTVILLGAFLVPATYVAFLYETDALYDVSPAAVALTFLYGGVLGSVAAQLLEGELVTGMGLVGLLAVGFSEELAKPLGLVWLARRQEYRSELHGIVLGAAAGMGFAAVETMGYAFTYFIVSKGNLDILGQVLLNRGLLSPFAHGTWTAILAGALWRERLSDGRFRLNRNVLKAFGLVVLLHALWDWTASAIPIGISLPSTVISWRFVDIVVPEINLPIPALLIGLWGMLVLAKMLREARHAPVTPSVAPAPPSAGSQAATG